MFIDYGPKPEPQLAQIQSQTAEFAHYFSTVREQDLWQKRNMWLKSLAVPARSAIPPCDGILGS
jgi:hypothetical protein